MTLNRPRNIIVHRLHGTLIVVTAALILSGCGKHEGSEQKSAPAPVALKGLVAEVVRSQAISESFDVVGTIRARTSAIVSPRIPGTVALLKVREGDRVKKGQLLVQLDAQENQAAAAAASAGIDDARRAVDEAQARRKLAESTHERYQRLFNEQAISRQEFDVKQTEKELAVQAAARAEARLKQAQEGARAAGTVADYTRITAPISGVVSSKPADLGATVFPSQPLMTIEEEGSYQLELAIPESMIAKVRPGTPVQVVLDALAASFGARIAEVVPAADPASRTFTARVNVARPGLKSGMFGRGTFSLGSGGTGLTVPKKAVVERGALTSVWTVGADGTVRMRLVKAGKTTGERVEILSGLADGERVVTGGVEKAVEGGRIE